MSILCLIMLRLIWYGLLLVFCKNMYFSFVAERKVWYYRYAIFPAKIYIISKINQ